MCGASCTEGLSPLARMYVDAGEDVDEEDPHVMKAVREFLKQTYNVELDVTLGWKTPTVGGQKLDLSKMYRVVATDRGGHNAVTVAKQWKQVADAFLVPKTMTNSSFLMRTHYERFLYEFEAQYRR